MRWSDPTEDCWDEPWPGAPSLGDITVEVSENPVVGELLGPRGEVLAQVLEREPIGYRQRQRSR